MRIKDKFYLFKTIVFFAPFIFVSWFGCKKDDSKNGQDDRPIYFKDPDPDKVITSSSGKVFPVDQMILNMVDGTKEARTQLIDEFDLPSYKSI